MLLRTSTTSSGSTHQSDQESFATPRLHALVALRNRARIEAEAPKWTRPGTYSEPFALRALGVARDDAQLLEQAAARFAEMGLEWHARETRKLRS